MKEYFEVILHLVKHIVLNKRTLVVEESIHIVFDESINQSDHLMEEEENIIEDKLDDLNLNKDNL